MIRKSTLLWLLCALLPLSACSQDQDYTLHSPDGRIAVALDLDGQGRLHYAVTRDGAVVLERSRLGLVLDDRDLAHGLRTLRADAPSLVEGAYTMVQGKQKDITYRARERRYRAENADGQVLELTLRASDDGIAFRYRVEGDAQAGYRVKDELTSFAFAGGSRAWLQPMAVAQTGFANTNPSYEELYLMDIPVGEPSPSAAGWVFPALFHTAGGWALLTEAGMDGHYHASRLQAQAPGGEYRIGFPTGPEVFPGGALAAQGTLPLASPWRIIAIGDLPTLLRSTLGTDLAQPALAPMPWVKPGLASWSWALLKDASVNADTQKRFIDYAAAMGWPYTLVDVNWDRTIGYEKMTELTQYAARKNVRLLLWYNSSGDWNETDFTPKSTLLAPAQRRAEFARLQQMGIAGIKVDFFAGDGQSMINYYRDILQDAADHRLLVNFHGCTLPRGLQRTFPNLMTMESARGLEFVTFTQDNADQAPEHMAMLPFTRNVFDPMDFTPTVLAEIPDIERRTRNGFELALPVLFLSGLQHVAETDAGMAQVPEHVRDYLMDIPVLWDESRLLDGYPGRFAVVARRSGDTWHVVGINADPENRRLALDLSFIGTRTGQMITDGATARDLVRSDLQAGATVTVDIRDRGGFVMKFPAPTATTH
ncbi:glycoside hydrolase family 97 catalytic domain-containing protein [Pseudoxanthomonas koreensis]|uniref:glycoside hydrolase family 97 protein n=1 Tax=Pseudoxanthomonas koreensis TaxID=266061 RepID=UPI0035A6F9D1